MLKRSERDLPVPEKRASKLRKKGDHQLSKEKEDVFIDEEASQKKSTSQKEIIVSKEKESQAKQSKEKSSIQDKEKDKSIQEGKEEQGGSEKLRSPVYFYFSKGTKENEFVCLLHPEIRNIGSNSHQKHVKVTHHSQCSNLHKHLSTWHNKVYKKILEGMDFLFLSYSND